jgi:hypothetical protein
VNHAVADEAAWDALVEGVRSHGALMIPAGDDPPAQFADVELTLQNANGGDIVTVTVQVAQVLGDQVALLVTGEAKDQLTEADYAGQKSSAQQPLWARVAAMTRPEKMRLAKRGNAEARRLLLNDPDPALHSILLTNPGATAMEIASWIKSNSASPSMIRTITERPELMGNMTVCEALVNNPHTPSNVAVKLVARVSLDTAKRIAKSGRGKAAVVTAARRRVLRK